MIEVHLWLKLGTKCTTGSSTAVVRWDSSKGMEYLPRHRGV